jgi:hypothetical protein
MKEFRKTEMGFFICEECNCIFIKKDGLSKHISIHHFTKKKYYDKWLKEKDDGKCKICKKETQFTNRLDDGYYNCCGIECVNKYKHLRTREVTLEKYGVKCLFSLKEKQEKAKQTKKEKYGNENYNNREKSKRTCLKKYNTECYVQTKKFKEKSKQTCLKNYGVTNPTKSKKIIEKSIQTCLKNYGVEHPSQNTEICQKAIKSRLYIYHYLHTNITYQGSYEFDFLKKHLDKYPDIQNAPSIKYIFNEKNKVYHPDFYIPSKNLIIEIKNSYLAIKDKDEIKTKEKATIANGFNYIMIIDKNYTKFNNNF